jgi:YfiH family protein
LDEFIRPNWPAPPHIKAFITTRSGGCSKPPFDFFNLAMHVDDDEVAVINNRQRLNQHLPSAPIWLNQTHTNNIISLTNNDPVIEPFDGSFTTQPNLVCTVMTADCLPVLLTNITGTFVAAVHAGWRGLASGIIANSLTSIPMDKRADVMAWLGPAIGPEQFEVGDDVRDVFVKLDGENQSAFVAHQQKWLCDIYQLATHQLKALGVDKIYGGQHCTFSQEKSFYSYRRDGACGRMASCIFIDPAQDIVEP